MDVAIIQAQHAPAREVIRDRRGIVIGVVEHQRLTGKFIARNKHGIVIGSFDGQATRNASGRIVAKTNVLPPLLLLER